MERPRSPALTPSEEAAEYRRLERAWQDDIGHALLDKPYDHPGSAAVFEHQSDRLIALLDPQRPGVVVEIGCGKGYFLRRLRDRQPLPTRTLVGIDLSRAAFSLPGHGLDGIQADGEVLPLRGESAAYVIYDGSLHHCIDYCAALREAVRVLAPGGMLILFEPTTSRFSRLMHRLLDPIVSRHSVAYESPIDVHYKAAFRHELVVSQLVGLGMSIRESRSDFLAYPFTGCYAGSPFARSERLMRGLLALEERIASMPILRHLAGRVAWRTTVVATKPAPAAVRAG